MDGVLPIEADLPPGRWLAIDDGFSAGGDGGGPGEAFDCVGPGFPTGDEVRATAATPHFLRPPASLLHAFGMELATDDAADRAERALRAPSFAACLAEAVAADIAGSATGDAAGARPELLAADPSPTADGHRVVFTGGTGAGIRAVVLDVVGVRAGRRVGLLWFADSPDPFPPADVAHVLDRMAARRA